jgi:hypothetical protein
MLPVYSLTYCQSHKVTQKIIGTSQNSILFLSYLFNDAVSIKAMYNE